MKDLLLYELNRIKDKLLFSFSFMILVLLVCYNVNNETLTTTFGYILALELVITLPVSLFSYLFKKSHATYVASLPYTRKQQFVYRYLLGLVCIISMSIVYTLSSYLLSIAISNDFLVRIVLGILLYYTLGCIIVLITGKKSLYIVNTICGWFGLYVMYQLIQVIALQFGNDYIISPFDQTTAYIFPALALVIGQLDSWLITVYLLFTLLGFTIALLLACNRACENSEKPVVFNSLEVITPVWVVLIISWLVATFNVATITGVFTIIVICSFVFLPLHHIIYNKKINIKYCIIQIVLVISISVGSYFGIEQYVTSYFPNSSNVDEISLVIHEDTYYTHTNLWSDNKAYIEEVYQLVENIDEMQTTSIVEHTMLLRLSIEQNGYYTEREYTVSKEKLNMYMQGNMEFTNMYLNLQEQRLLDVSFDYFHFYQYGNSNLYLIDVVQEENNQYSQNSFDYRISSNFNFKNLNNVDVVTINSKRYNDIYQKYSSQESEVDTFDFDEEAFYLYIDYQEIVVYYDTPMYYTIREIMQN